MRAKPPTRRRARRVAPPADERPAPGTRAPLRQLVHGRQLVCRAYRRDDGRWDIEGRLADVKTRDFRLGGVQVAAGEPYRALALALTVDGALVVKEARIGAETKAAGSAAEARAATACATLHGRCIDAHSAPETTARFAQAAECSHLAELLAAVIATAGETVLAPRAGGPGADD